MGGERRLEEDVEGRRERGSEARKKQGVFVSTKSTQNQELARPRSGTGVNPVECPRPRKERWTHSSISDEPGEMAAAKASMKERNPEALYGEDALPHSCGGGFQAPGASPRGKGENGNQKVKGIVFTSIWRKHLAVPPTRRGSGQKKDQGWHDLFTAGETNDPGRGPSRNEEKRSESAEKSKSYGPEGEWTLEA